PCFAIGSIVMQFPLGAWSDVLGRRKVLLISIAIGIISFICASIYEDSLLGLFITFSVAGMFVESLFSLVISYMADIVPVFLIVVVLVSIMIALLLHRDRLKN